jgi:hypothetical protein
MAEILVNRAPFLVLWASVVAQRLGYSEEEALTLGKAVAGQTAAAKGVRLGILEKRSEAERQEVLDQREALGAVTVQFMDRTIPCLRMAEGLRALADARPIDPASVRRYLASKFKDDLASLQQKLVALAAELPPDELGDRAMDLYMRMRPDVPPGEAGWGRQGRLDVGAIDRLRTQGL